MRLKFSIFHVILFSFFNLMASEYSFVLPDQKEFKKYWYQSGAELSKYDLNQARYGELHKGHAVLIFVTEDFNPKLQVKADRKSAQNIPVLKLNATRKFNTGIYPYSTMSSIFSGVDVKKHPLPFKSTHSVQEWCGMVFTQMNLKGKEKAYQIQNRSYFESESDKDFTLSSEVYEEGIFNMIRLDPGQLPLGNIKIIPATLFTRFVHIPLTVKNATASLQPSKLKSETGMELMHYLIEYKGLKRTVSIHFEKKFPFKIQEWHETYPGIMGGKTLTTSAKRTHTLKSAYWGKHKNSDRKLMEKLGLEAY